MSTSWPDRNAHLWFALPVATLRGAMKAARP